MIYWVYRKKHRVLLRTAVALGYPGSFWIKHSLTDRYALPPRGTPMAKKSAPKKRKSKKQRSSDGMTKAQSIRDTATELGKKVRPRDIIAALGAKGITVSSPQVSTTLKAAGLRRGRRRRKVAAAVAARQHSGNGQGLDIHELLQVKKLAEQLGGTGKLKELAAALERLI
jgi:hypothetical protein